MVKHGRNKKRRAGRIGRTKLKNHTWNRWDPSPKFRDKTIRENWDASKSYSANLAEMGLVAKPNDLNSPPPTSSGDVHQPKKSHVVELFDVPDSDKMTSSYAAKFPLSADDEKYMAKCLEAHGDNYTAMFRDTKVNFLQHTEQKLRKLGSRYLLLEAEQRRIEVPPKVQKLLPGSMPPQQQHSVGSSKTA